MSTESIAVLFRICNLVAMAGWVTLVLFPRSVVTRRGIRNGALSTLFGVVYATLFLFPSGFSVSDFQSLEGVQRLFQNPVALLAGWVHYLAFDLLVGVWMVGDAEKRSIRHGYIVPALLLTFVFGPVGFLTYLLTRKALGKA